MTSQTAPGTDHDRTENADDLFKHVSARALHFFLKEHGLDVPPGAPKSQLAAQVRELTESRGKLADLLGGATLLELRAPIDLLRGNCLPCFQRANLCF